MVKDQGEFYPSQDFDRGRRSTCGVCRRDTPLYPRQSYDFSYVLVMLTLMWLLY